MLKVIYSIIIFGLIPAILAAFFVIAAVLPGRAPTDSARLAGRAGFWAGLVLFAAYSVSVIGSISSPTFNVTRLPSFNLRGLLLGVALGFLFLWLIEVVLPTRGIGILTMLLCASSTIGLFAYLFYSDMRDFTMYFTLGSLFGVLLNVILFPDVARGIGRTTARG